VERTGQLHHQFGGDRWTEELAALYDTYGAALYGYLLVLLGSPEEAEDVLQELFARLLSKGRKLARLRNAEAYLFRSARNEAFSRLRRRRVRERGQEVLKETARLLDAVAGNEVSPDELERVNSAMQQLPPEQREVIVLKFFHGMTFGEIGKVAGISPNTAASRYRYALDKLKLLLEEENEDERQSR
jgi:RNA polymerase sigma-70 factor (ECF subfamily)